MSASARCSLRGATIRLKVAATMWVVLLGFTSATLRRSQGEDEGRRSETKSPAEAKWTPLADAVAKFNEKAEPSRVQAPYSTRPVLLPILRTPPLTPEGHPTQLTVDEVIDAIRGWDRQKKHVDDKTYLIYRRIAETRSLPPGAELSGGAPQWFRYGKEDKHEYWVWWIDLSVTTDERTGYGFRIRDQRLGRRVAMLPRTGRSWLIEPRELKREGWFGEQICHVEQDQDGVWDFIVAYSGQPKNEVVSVELVVLDETGEIRTSIPLRGLGALDGVVMVRARFDPRKFPNARYSCFAVECQVGASTASGAVAP